MAMCPVCFSPITFLYSCCLKLLQRRALVWIFLLSNQQVSTPFSPSQARLCSVTTSNKLKCGKDRKGHLLHFPFSPYVLSLFATSSTPLSSSPLLPSPLLCLVSYCPLVLPWKSGIYLFLSFASSLPELGTSLKGKKGKRGVRYFC